MTDSPAPLAPAGELRIHAANRVVPAGAEFSFEIRSAARPDQRLENVRLFFPGFRPAGPPEEGAGGGVRVRGSLPGPGFHPFTAAADDRGRTVSGADYFMVRERVPVEPGPEAGYYVFLGCGDYPIITGRETHVLASWTESQWKDLVAWMGANGMNRLWVLMNGYTLAYPSARWPGLRDRHARNVADNFLAAVIRHAHVHGVKVTLMLTTDGHARGFSRAYPEAARLDREGRPCPQFGLALEHPLTREYILGVLDEVLDLYPEADGIAVHPTESDPDRFNPESLAAFRAETGRDLRCEPADGRRVWHNRVFARFLGEVVARCRRINPALDVVMANCLWQDDHVALNRAELPETLRIAVWNYDWEDLVAKPWPIYRWVEAFGARRVLYMPTSQSYLYPTEAARVMDRHIGTDRLLSTAAALGVRDTVYFAGWDIPPEEARLCDLLLARHPTLGRAGPGARSLIPALYRDYFGVREALAARSQTRPQGTS
jgi:hypothetical protein